MPLDDRRKVAIVGFCGTSRDRTPYEDASFEIWGLNRGYIFMLRADRWFDMHSPSIRGWEMRRPGTAAIKHMDWLRDFGGPVYLHEAEPDAIPNSITYPLQEIAADLGPWVYRLDEHGAQTDITSAPYLTSSISYEIALAIYEKFEEIHILGVDLNTESEYVWQKPGVEYLIGVATGRGIKVVLPDNCPLLQGKLYGRAFMAETGEHMSAEQIESRLQAIQQEQTRIAQKFHEMMGARRELEFLQSEMVPGVDHEKLEERRKKMDQAVSELQGKLYQVQGAIAETLYWAHQTPDGQDPSEAIQQLQEPLRELSSSGSMIVKRGSSRRRNGHVDESAEGDLSTFAELEDATPTLVVAGIAEN